MGGLCLGMGWDGMGWDGMGPWDGRLEGSLGYAMAWGCGILGLWGRRWRLGSGGDGDGMEMRMRHTLHAPGGKTLCSESPEPSPLPVLISIPIPVFDSPPHPFPSPPRQRLQ